MADPNWVHSNIMKDAREFYNLRMAYFNLSKVAAKEGIYNYMFSIKALNRALRTNELALLADLLSHKLNGHVMVLGTDAWQEDGWVLVLIGVGELLSILVAELVHILEIADVLHGTVREDALSDGVQGLAW